MVETRWSWERQLYWGIILFIIFFAANMFFFDETLLFKTLLNLFIALLSLGIAFFALKTFKVTPARLKTNQFTQIYLLLFAFCLLLFMLASPLASLKAMLHSKYLPLALLSTFTGSLFEEAICRGLILSAFLGWSYYNSFKHSFLISAILSSLLFALMYLINFFSNTPRLTFKEMLCAFCFGLVLCMLRLITNGLAIPIIFHFILELLLNNYSIGVMFTLIPIFALSLFALYQLDQAQNALKKVNLV